MEIMTLVRIQVGDELNHLIKTSCMQVRDILDDGAIIVLTHFVRLMNESLL